MVQRYEAVSSILNKWYETRAHYLPWPDELMQPVTVTRGTNDASAAVEAEWEKDWIDIGGEG